MSLFNMFKGSDTPAPAPTPATPGNVPANPPAAPASSDATAPNGVVPAIDPNANPATPAAPDSPLAEFKTLWDDVPIDKDAPAATPTALDPAKLQEIVSKADFTSALNPDNLAAIQAGGEGATQAFTESLNSVAQQVLMQATLAANKMTEQAVNNAVKAQAATIPDLIRSQTTSNNLQKANPLFANPAVKPVIDAVRSQLEIKHPNATPDQLTEMAQNFVSVMGEAFNPSNPATPGNSGVKDGEDFSTFLNVT